MRKRAASAAGSARLLRRVLDCVDRAGKAERDIDIFYPFLLIRSKVGDDGRRPIGPSWRSPDIRLELGAPDTTPELPPPRTAPAGPWADESYLIGLEGQVYTVYAHVWNLGLAPAAGVRVEFYFSADPSRPETAELIGVAHVDLASRLSPACHRLVKCPSGWRPHTLPPRERLPALFVRVSAIDDRPNAADVWRPQADRHVAAHSILIDSPGGVPIQ